ncbi:hypothetical protein BC833DRAFT_576043 [Globomyces pollinis-pini]|nr:hypothetical protein BC833DRAFT_576043 [Globomyces pollinis-pini]
MFLRIYFRALDTNQLTGTIPKALSNLKKLTMLHLSQNNLSGPIPLTVAQLPALTDLVFDSRNAPPQGALDPNRNSSSTAPQTFDVSPNNWLSILTLTGFGLILFVSVGLAITRIQKKNRKKKLKDSTLPTVLNTSSEKIDTMYPPRRVHQPIEIHRGLSLKSSGEVVRANTMISGVSAFSFQSNASAIPYRYNSLKSNNAAKISTIPRLNQSSGSLPETLNKIDEGERNDNPASPTNESFTSNLDDIQILAEQQQSRMATPGGMLKNNYPDRLFYFADKSGTDPFIDLINFLFFPVYVNLKAERAYQPLYDDEMKIQENDIILVLEHNYDGWCLGLNATTGLRGQFPLACTAPPHSTCVVLIYFQGLNDDFINHPLVQALLLSYPFAIRIKTLGLNPLTYFDCQDIFGHMKADNQKCFICGPRYFSQNISQLVNHYNTQENWNITTVETIDPDSTII